MSQLDRITPPITLRDVVPDDRSFLFDVYAASRAEELAPVPWSAEQKEQFLRQQFDAQDRWYHDQYAGTAFQVILVDGVPAGRLYVTRWDDRIHVLDISLLPSHRGLRIGTVLFHTLMAEAAQVGKRVSIHVESFNRARVLYERLGFRQREDESGAGVYLYMEWHPPAPAAERS